MLLSQAEPPWPAELAQHFRPQLAALAVAAGAVALLLRRRGQAGAALLIALLLGEPVIASLLPEGAPREAGRQALGGPGGAGGAEGVGDKRRLTLLAANLLHTNDRTGRLVEALAAADADVLVLTEAIPSWTALTGLRARYPHRTPEAWWAGTSTVVWSRHPLLGGADVPRRLAGGYVLEVTLQVGGRPLRLFALHAPRAWTRSGMRERNDVLTRLGDWAGERRGGGDRPTVLAGDFNATPWTPAVRRLLDRTGLRRARPHGWPAYGWYASWPAPLGALGIPIDLLLHDPDIGLERFEVLELPGSDHLAVKARLALP